MHIAFQRRKHAAQCAAILVKLVKRQKLEHQFRTYFMSADTTLTHDETSEREQRIQLAKNAGPDAVAELLEVYRPWLNRLAQDKIASWLRPRMAASDVVQGSILLAMEAFPQFRGRTEAELLSWLRRIFANHMVDRQRELLSQKRNLALEVPIEGDHAADSQTPSQIMAAQEDANRVVEAIANLNEDLRAVVQLRYLYDLSFAQIATELNVSRHIAQRKWIKALGVLARHLKGSETSRQNE